MEAPIKTQVRVIGREELKDYLDKLNFDENDREFRQVMFNGVRTYRNGLLAMLRASKHNQRRGTLPCMVDRHQGVKHEGHPAIIIGMTNKTEGVKKVVKAHYDKYKNIAPNVAFIDGGTIKRYTRKGGYRGFIVGDRFVTLYRDSHLDEVTKEFTNAVVGFLKEL